MIRVLAAAAALLPILLAAPVWADPAPPVARIDAALAPVALYPDALLTPLLMGATYPEEVAEADGWLGEAHNGALRGDALMTALEPRPWDPSVKALVPFPVILDMMATRPTWMKQIGDAFAGEPATVMAEIQKLRHAAIAAGKLKSTARLVVTESGGVVSIAPADPAVVNVPVYNPALVYGAWAYPDHPPVFIEPPQGFEVSGADMQTGIGFSVGFGVLAPLWGWAHPDWAHGAVTIDTAAYNRINRYGPHQAAATWHHEAHGTGYFHITQDQITPLKPPAAKHAAKAARSKHEAARKPARGGHAIKHAKAGSRARGKVKTARGHGAVHRGKMHVAADASRAHRRR